MKLHHFTHSPNCRRVRMFLAEKGVEVEHANVDMMQGEQLSEAFTALNPRCTLPLLETDEGETLAEAVAIMAYFEAQTPDAPLFGSDALERGRVMMWEHRAEQDGFGSVEDYVRNSFEVMAGRAKPGPGSTAQIPALAERGRARLLQFYAEVDAELGKHEYLAGASFSVADITLLSVVDFAAGFGKVEVPEELSNLGRWHATVSERPSAKA